MKVRLRTPAEVRVVFDGQSHNIWPISALYDGKGPYPDRVMRFFPPIPWHNAAVGDEGWTDLSDDAATRLHRQARDRAGVIDVLVMAGGQGDIYRDGVDGATAYARAVAYADAARAAGFDWIIASTMPAFGPGGTINPTSDMLQARIDHNDLMMAGDDFDAVIDLHTHPVLADATNATWWESDRAHFKAPTADLVADLVKPYLAAAIPA